MNTASQPARSLRRRSGFSLVEMIGVLAIIAILAVIIVPKVFSTINSSRITSAVAATNTFKTAVTDFYSRYSNLPLTNNGSRLDDLLVQTGITESRFTAKIGTVPSGAVGPGWQQGGTGWTVVAGGANQNNQSRIVCQTYAAGAPSTVGGRNFYLNGNNAGLPTGSRIVSAVLMQVSANDARELSQRIDGDLLTAAAGLADDNGRVVYAAPAANGLTNVYIYLVHQ